MAPRRLALLAATVLAAAGLSAPAASARPHLLVGLYDDAQTLYGNPDVAFPLLQKLRVQVVRVSLYWGGPLGVARRKPKNPSNPADRAYDWSRYDRAVNYAGQYGIKVVFSIWGTPPWANGAAGLNFAPRNPLQLQQFAFAAAKRYSGGFVGLDGRTLPPVRMWLAWNEPNNPIFLKPQFARKGGKRVPQAGYEYAKICNSIYDGVHSTFLADELVACGVTGPRGNNHPGSSRPSMSPIAFMRAAKIGGMRTFDVYAHHPYYGSPSEEPGKSPPLAKRGQPPTAVTLGNIKVLLDELTRLYGPKHLWITEYGYQTNPPDKVFGVTRARQAAYLRQSYAIARKNPRIDMMVWFLLQDEPNLNRWQSGLITVKGVKKPAFAAFQRLPH